MKRSFADLEGLFFEAHTNSSRFPPKLLRMHLENFTEQAQNLQQVGKTNKILQDLPDLEKQLLECVHFHNNEGLNYASEFRLSDVYVELAHSGAIYAPHEHANCLFSGTFFISYQEEQHAYLKFKRQVQSQMFPVMMLPFKQMTAFNLQEATVPFKNGDVVIYPSNLTHGYESNQTDGRITLTFNVVPQ